MTEAAYFCPKCQSPLVTYSMLEGGAASCGACGWKGLVRDLLGHTFESGFTDEESIFRAFAQDVKMMMTRHGLALELGRMLIKWGFMQATEPSVLVRYMTAVTRAVAKAIVEERQAQEKENPHVS